MELDERQMENERRLNQIASEVAITRETVRMQEKFQTRTEETLGVLTEGQHTLSAQQGIMNNNLTNATNAIVSMRTELDARKEEAIQAKTKDRMWTLFAQLLTSTVAISIVAAFAKFMGWLPQ